MEKYCIRERCKVNTNRDADVFVGILCEDGDIQIHFPLGFRISEEEKELRKDIMLLIRTIGATTARKDSEIFKEEHLYGQTAFPMQSYMHVIADYFARGYYKEREVSHAVAKRGKIDWNRTIKTQRPYVTSESDGGETSDAGNGENLEIADARAAFFYLDFVTRKSRVSEDELITLIHKYCVYESFEKIGWLYTDSMPARPSIKYNGKLFKAVVRNKLQNTFHDRNKALFRSMLAILEYEGNPDGGRNYRYGTRRFEYVWEALIDRAYGIAQKAAYFPKTEWQIGEAVYGNSRLEPDSIMPWQGDVYVLDAKYYKYGVTGRPLDLPQSAAINKQITYGEYVATQEKFKELHGETFQVYNAFLMPFAAGEGERPVIQIGEARSDWKSGRETYERVQGILIDTKHLMKVGMRGDEEEKRVLAEKIRGENL